MPPKSTNAQNLPNINLANMRSIYERLDSCNIMETDRMALIAAADHSRNPSSQAILTNPQVTFQNITKVNN